mmetsp:Transcript_103796/g.334664  ORF Transcript_103796/g.334664 Transcript_103796/m.334664 type:complete len:291 (-) Transcript_103796:99-971(-)
MLVRQPRGLARHATTVGLEGALRQHCLAPLAQLLHKVGEVLTAHSRRLEHLEALQKLVLSLHAALLLRACAGQLPAQAFEPLAQILDLPGEGLLGLPGPSARHTCRCQLLGALGQGLHMGVHLFDAPLEPREALLEFAVSRAQRGQPGLPGANAARQGLELALRRRGPQGLEAALGMLSMLGELPLALCGAGLQVVEQGAGLREPRLKAIGSGLPLLHTLREGAELAAARGLQAQSLELSPKLLHAAIERLLAAHRALLQLAALRGDRREALSQATKLRLALLAALHQHL